MRPPGLPDHLKRKADPVWVDNPHRLAAEARRWRRAPAIGVDTEFVRERTFYPGIGLIQVSHGDENVLIDPLAIHDLDPLRDVLLDPDVVKVMHSCGEDLEVLYHRFEVFPRALFDTQIAAVLTGRGTSPAYATLVAELCGDELPKGETRSNWLRRPLSESQRFYAALDVAYLLPMYRRLDRELRRLGRAAWLEEQIEQLFDVRRFLPDPDTVYRSFAKWNMSRRELAVLRAVAAWREREARRRDLPRNFVLPKEALADLARQKPRNARELDRAKSLRPQDRKRYGRSLLREIRDALALPEAELPPAMARPIDLSSHRREVRQLKRAVADKAQELGIPAEILAPRRTLERILRRRLAGKTPIVPPSIAPWRRRILAPLAPGSGEQEAG